MWVVGNLPCMKIIVNPRRPSWMQFGQFMHLDGSHKHHKTQCLCHLSDQMTKHKTPLDKHQIEKLNLFPHQDSL